ncbi:hypothetical protein DICSQDRAFT_138693 [Dichomitus squalens LYAD-421 SS1]|uniref:Uncharacterized protein n=1 Tax=Dichomitus squalens (strain LYAD-421) TaxID=732165 RepID=R7ST74_DICSQ|nr:uncharacterized protein DICSQDRAFT_138693 [Dichomitus squalens LYAD-421 SS1]EJF59246.1 hypothetical protein DICSQDRAFT_138693 [Dichomitus squalens LYAD-421 SS1]
MSLTASTKYQSAPPALQIAPHQLPSPRPSQPPPHPPHHHRRSGQSVHSHFLARVMTPVVVPISKQVVHRHT